MMLTQKSWRKFRKLIKISWKSFNLKNFLCLKMMFLRTPFLFPEKMILFIKAGTILISFLNMFKMRLKWARIKKSILSFTINYRIWKKKLLFTKECSMIRCLIIKSSTWIDSWKKSKMCRLPREKSSSSRWKWWKSKKGNLLAFKVQWTLWNLVK